MGAHKGLGESMKRIKSKAQLYVEQANNYLRSIGTFNAGAMPIAHIDRDGDCALYDRNINPREAVELGMWLIETFTEKEIEE